jgi:hypothetical protein
VSIVLDYRFYSLRNSNQIVGTPEVMQCVSDQEAIAEARKLLDGFDMEVWQGARVVVRLRSSDK